MLRRGSARLGLLAAGLLWARPAPVAACKPAAFIAEKFDLELVAAHRAGRPAPLSGFPARLGLHSSPYDQILSFDIGWLPLVEHTRPLPAKVERTIRRHRRRFVIQCYLQAVVFHEPIVPGRFTTVGGERDTDADARWRSTWPSDVDGTLEVMPTRDRVRLHIERPDGPLELEYRLRHRTYCDVTTDTRPPALLLVVALAVRRRRR
ncbi:hypothetical protein [Nannocystis punicea]|uniref:Uncharacterized protein n=1 Tax=Nannocystis punicea TaxID=2995304 RepID=A0ABY7H1A7_9BACT|nr:hypothetical protein [Nannocystis poenicansa]WAS92854.1 hypothetical protein O0S08_42325 [Nannocystis poenicansa]